jgi:predicted  nucleic acid-binding Zn-ribbon protein
MSFVNAELARTEQEAREAAEKSKAELDKRDRQIAGLETEKDDLTKQMNALTGRITGLEGQIKETERKLSASEGDREGLRKELRRLVAEKAELEHKFQDLAVLREQVRKLKEDLAVARRIEFIRKGLYGFDKKGGQLLQEGVHRPTPLAPPAPVGSGLDVEVRSDGGPAKVRTNAPAGR